MRSGFTYRDPLVGRTVLTIAAAIILGLMSSEYAGGTAPAPGKVRRPPTRLVVFAESSILPDPADTSGPLQAAIPPELAEVELLAEEGAPPAHVFLAREEDKIPAVTPGLLDFARYGYPPAILVGGYVLVPLDGFADWTGDSVFLYPDRTVLVRGESVMEFLIGQRHVILVEKDYELPCPPGWYRCSPMVPLAALAGIIGFDCAYVKDEQIARLSFYGTPVDVRVQVLHPDDYFRDFRASRRMARGHRALEDLNHAVAAAEFRAAFVECPNSRLRAQAREGFQKAFAVARAGGLALTDLPPVSVVEGRRNPLIEVRNATFLKLTVYWGGPTDTSVVVPPGQTALLPVGPGAYKVAAKVDDSRVVSFVGAMSYDQGFKYTLVFNLSQLG